MRQAVHQAAAVAAVLGSTFFVQAATAAEYATVISSSPVTASVPVSRQVCSEGQQVVQQPPSGAGAVIGAIAGGVLGHTVGNGFGRAAATGVGAVTGAIVGNQVEANANPPTTVPVQRCQMVTSYENRVVGYDVMYDYAGQHYSTRMAHDPGKQFAVSVQPTDAGAAILPAPVYADPAPVATVPQTVYYAPVPPAVYVDPMIGFGFGYYGGYGYRGGRHWR